MTGPKYDKECDRKEITNSEIQRIKRVVYRTFEKFKDQKIINSADFVVSLDLEKLIKCKDSIKFSYLSIARSVILMKIKKLKFQTMLAKYLKENEDTALKLGFLKDNSNNPMIPDQRTFSYYISRAFDRKTLEIINCIADIIRADSERFGMVFDEHIEEIKPIEKEENKYQNQYKTEQKQRMICKLAKKIIISRFRFPYMRPNCKYDLNSNLRLAIYLALKKEFATGGAQLLRNDLKDKPPDNISPEGQNLLYNIKKFEKNDDGMIRMFVNISEAIFNETKKRTKNFLERKVDVAIDHTEIWYFVRKNKECFKYLPLMTRMVEKPKSTKWCIRFIVISIVNKGKKYILLALPVKNPSEEPKIDPNKFDEHKIVEQLIEYAKKRVRINVILADRYFSQDSGYINLFKKLGLKYVMIAKRTPEIKNLLDKELKDKSLPWPMTDMAYGNSRINLIVVRGREEKKIAYITNINFSKGNTNQVQFFARKLDQLYDERWNIETTFKKVKEILPRTTSNKSYSIRLFYFLLAVSLYNICIMAESMLSLFKYGKIIKENSISFKIFLQAFFSEMLVT